MYFSRLEDTAERLLGFKEPVQQAEEVNNCWKTRNFLV